MDQNIKNRLVGITVIFALAVIFLPMILDGSGVRKDKLEVVIPPQPLVESNPEFDSRIVELTASAQELQELSPRFVDENSAVDPGTGDNTISRQSTPSDESASLKEPDITTAQSNPAPEVKTGGDSWVLQVGSFQDREKALAQRDKIRKSKISAVFIEQFTLNKKPSYRVRLGPFVNRDQTRVAQNKIKAKHDIDGIIMKYER